MNRTTVIILLAVVAAVCALVVFMDVREPINFLAGGLLALAAAVILVATP